MSGQNFNLRNIDPKVMLLLKEEAFKQKVSINSLILHIINDRFAMTHTAKKTIFHDLDHLAGTWQEEDAKKFYDNTKPFETLDEELWS